MATRISEIEIGKTASADRFLPIPPSGPPVRWHPEDDFASVAQTPQAISKAIRIPYVQPKYIPSGFTREGYYVYRCPGCNTKTAVTRYVDGLSSLSVIQAPEDCEQHTDKKPLDFGLGKAVFSKSGPSYFWVMGELSEEELNRVSQSLVGTEKS
jgi:hypothetical protein